MSEITYPLTYKIDTHNPPVTADKVPEGHGACDALVTISVKENDEDKSCNYSVLSVDGRFGKEFTAEQLFQTWLIMARHMRDRLPEGGPKLLVGEVLRIEEQARAAAAQ